MQRLGMPYIEMNRFYDIQKIQRQYALLGGALGVKFDDAAYYEEASKALEAFRERHQKLTFAIGQTVNANPFELAAALLAYGYAVDRVFANATPADLPFITKIAEYSPDTRFYTSISPTMMNYKLEGEVDIAIGKDAAWYYPEAAHVPFFSDVQPFGYRGLMRLLAEMEDALRANTEVTS
jgi:nitrogenase molybdenum-cofactor synthesis protein NifE